MLKYEHVSRSDRDTSVFASRVIASGAACRVTTTYIGVLPDIRYYYKGEWHRTDGPAYIDVDFESVDFWVNGVVHYSTELYCKVAGMSDEETFMWVLRFGDFLPNTCEEYYGAGWKDMALEDF